MTTFPTTSMKIALVGAGNLATHLALSLVKAGHHVVGICSKTGETARSLSLRIEQESMATSRLDELPKADVYLIATKDDVISTIAEEWPGNLSEGLIVHTSGSVDINVLAPAGIPYGVLYPLQTFSKERDVDFKKIPCFVEGSTTEDTMKLMELARSVSNKVYTLSSEHRRLLHLSAVFACNFVNHLYDIAEQQLKQNGFPTEWLQPLIEETAAKIKTVSAREAQTGPAIRKDQRVIECHSAILAQEPQHLLIYNILTESIYQTFHQ
jgi:hypothetical protein